MSTPHSKASMLEYSEIPEELKPINHRHIHAIDKLYRMHAGASTHLTALHDGVFELETRIDHRKRNVSNERFAENIARSWHRNAELRACLECRIRFYQSAGPSGFTIPTKRVKGKGPETLAQVVLPLFKQMAEAQKLPAPLIAEYSISLAPKGALSQNPNSHEH